MSRYVFLLVVLSVLLSSFAQIVLKAGMSNAGVLMALQNGSNLVALRAISTNLYVIGGLGLYFASAAVWLLVLARIDVSLAYPMVG
ncbi:MAG: hypothetical protein Q8J65_08230, partial [Nitrosomonadales bacterium]|nr:hypothetical protein [Nitrosomonadales bacterium]